MTEPHNAEPPGKSPRDRLRDALTGQGHPELSDEGFDRIFPDGKEPAAGPESDLDDLLSDVFFDNFQPAPPLAEPSQLPQLFLPPGSDTALRGETGIVRWPLADVRAHAEAIMARARQKADGILQAANLVAKRTIADADIEAERTRATATQILDEAWDQRAQALEDVAAAHREADRTRQLVLQMMELLRPQAGARLNLPGAPVGLLTTNYDIVISIITAVKPDPHWRDDCLRDRASVLRKFSEFIAPGRYIQLKPRSRAYAPPARYDWGRLGHRDERYFLAHLMAVLAWRESVDCRHRVSRRLTAYLTATRDLSERFGYDYDSPLSAALERYRGVPQDLNPGSHDGSSVSYADPCSPERPPGSSYFDPPDVASWLEYVDVDMEKVMDSYMNGDPIYWRPEVLTET